jgi:hypothetical protein
MKLGVTALVVLLLAVAPPAAGHPHGPDSFDVAGTLTRVDVANRIVEIDTVAGPGSPSRHLLLFVDFKVTVRDGTKETSLLRLRTGQRVVCTVRAQQQPGRENRERMTVSEIAVDRRAPSAKPPAT